MPVWLGITILFFGFCALLAAEIRVRVARSTLLVRVARSTLLSPVEKIQYDLAREEAPALAAELAKWFNSDKPGAHMELIVQAGAVACALGWKVEKDPISGQKIVVQSDFAKRAT